MLATTLLRAFAALLIVNSHLEDFYPLRPLAADGLLGDSLFFLLSGFGLALSDQRSRRGFLSWYGRRLGRIYPSVFLAVLIFDLGLKGGWQTWTLADYPSNFLWPRAYGFVGQILVFYVPFFFLLRMPGRRWLPGLVLGLFAAYAIVPLAGRSPAALHAFHWAFYFQVMLFGGWLARRPEWTEPGGWKALAAWLALLATYGGLRFAAATGRLGVWSFAPCLLVLPLGWLALRLCRARGLAAWLEGHPGVSRAVALVGGITLEIYLAHYQLVTSHSIATLPFPLNIAVFFVGSILLAQALAWASAGVRAVPRMVGGLFLHGRAREETSARVEGRADASIMLQGLTEPS